MEVRLAGAYGRAMKVTRESILKALGEVQDPDLKKDLVTLGMIDDVQIEGEKVSFKVVLTTPACPLKEIIKKDCEQTIARHHPGKIGRAHV